MVLRVLKLNVLQKIPNNSLISGNVQIGPRMELEVVKVQEGLAEGRVLFHRYVSRTAEQVAGKEVEIEEKAALKADRRRIQEENLRKKAKEAAREAPPVEVRIPLIFSSLSGSNTMRISVHNAEEFSLGDNLAGPEYEVRSSWRGL